MGFVIAVLNQKGGSGKTTLASHLARAAAIDGLRVLLVDGDKQGSLRDWHAAGDGCGLDLVAADTAQALATVPNLASGFDLVLVDGMPSATANAAAAVRGADAVLIPVQPSPLDLWAAGELVDLVKQRQELTGGALRAGLVISRAIVGSKLEAEVQAALADFGIDVLEGRTHQRVVYPSAMARGLTALDTEPEGAASLEIKQIWREVKKAWL